MAKDRAISRRKLATYVTSQFMSGNGDHAIQQAAAYLIETRQIASAGLLIRDIEEILATHGIVVADITTARSLSKDIEQAAKQLLGAKELHVREHSDQSVLGGVLVEVSDKRLDGTLRHKIDLLKRLAIKERTV